MKNNFEKIELQLFLCRNKVSCKKWTSFTWIRNRRRKQKNPILLFQTFTKFQSGFNMSTTVFLLNLDLDGFMKWLHHQTVWISWAMEHLVQFLASAHHYRESHYVTLCYTLIHRWHVPNTTQHQHDGQYHIYDEQNFFSFLE